MAAIIVGVLRFRDVFKGDLFDVSIKITGIYLTGKTLRCQVRENADADPVLTFSEDDGSLTTTITAANTTTVRFYKEAEDMDVPVLADGALYQLTIVMFTDDSAIEDTLTIVEGDMQVVDQYTIL